MDKFDRYKQLADLATKAVEDIKDKSLKEIAFTRFLDHELDTSTPSSSKKKPRGKTAKRTSVRASIPESVRSEVKQLTLSATEKGLILWKELKLKWHRYLWILKAAENHGVNELTSAEIAYLIREKFREKSDETSAGNLGKKIKDGYVMSVKIGGRVGYKILKKGIDLVTRPTGNSS